MLRDTPGCFTLIATKVPAGIPQMDPPRDESSAL